MKIRIKFEKQGMMKFIGHLDVMRYFQKVMRRADVDIRYSGGFSPHQIMSFAAPLGVGLLSKGEYLDIEVLSTDDSETMIRRMNETMVEGTRILSYRRLPEESKNAMSIVAAADYLLWFREGKEPEDMEGFFDGLSRFYSQEQILIRKKTKKGEKDMDLKPLIYELRRQETSDGKEGIFMKVSTGSTDNVKPELVMEALYQFLDLDYPLFAMEIQREEVYADLGEENFHRFVPLEDLGEDLTVSVPREAGESGGEA